MITALHLLVSTSRSVAFNPMQLRNPNIGFRAAQATRTRAPHPDKFRRLVVCSSSNLKNIPAQRHEWHYEILQTYPILNVDQMEQSLPRFIHSINPNEYSSVSQAKKACRFGAIIVSRDKDAFGKQSKEEDCVDFDMYTTSDKFEVLDQNRTIFIASPETTVVEGDVIAVRARIKDSFYPSSCTSAFCLIPKWKRQFLRRLRWVAWSRPKKSLRLLVCSGPTRMARAPASTPPS